MHPASQVRSQFLHSKLALARPPIAHCIHQRQQLVQPRVSRARRRHILMQRQKAVPSHASFCIRPYRRRLISALYPLIQWSSSISRRHPTRHLSPLRRKGIPDAMLQKLAKPRPIQLLLFSLSLNQVRSSRPLHRRIDLRRVQMQLSGKLQVRPSLTLVQ